MRDRGKIMEIAERLKMVRESTGRTQKDFAGHIDASYRTIQDYEAGNSIPGGRVLAQFIQLGFSVNWILAGQGEMCIPSCVKSADDVHGDALQGGDCRPAAYDEKLLSTLVLQLERTLDANNWTVTPTDKAALLSRLFAKYRQAGTIDVEELRWAAKLANTNKCAKAL